MSGDCVPRETSDERAPRHRRIQASMESYFLDLASAIEGCLAAGETSLAWFSAETSDFVRMNRGKVRQPGTVVQRYLDVELIRGAKHASHRLVAFGSLWG